jgi:predicted HTH domain antitoxin
MDGDGLTGGATVATRALTVELPEELVALLGSPEAGATKARRALVIELLRDGSVSQGQAARLLGVSRWDLLDLMARLGVPSGPETAEEMRQEVATARQTHRR